MKQLVIHLPLTVKVRERCGAYVTATVAGQRTSCTYSAQEAVGRLVDKLAPLWGMQPGDLVAKRLADMSLPAGESAWQLQRNNMGGDHADQT